MKSVQVPIGSETPALFVRRREVNVDDGVDWGIYSEPFTGPVWSLLAAYSVSCAIAMQLIGVVAARHERLSLGFANRWILRLMV